MKRKWVRKDIGTAKVKAAVKILAVVCAAFGWWGVLYPELTMTPDTYAVIPEEAVQNSPEVVEWDFDSNVYWNLLEAESSQIRFRSRLINRAGKAWTYK